MKTSNHDFLEKIAKEALEKANEMDVDEPKLVWPTSEDVRYQGPKSWMHPDLIKYQTARQLLGVFVPKGTKVSAENYPLYHDEKVKTLIAEAIKDGDDPGWMLDDLLPRGFPDQWLPKNPQPGDYLDLMKQDEVASPPVTSLTLFLRGKLSLQRVKEELKAETEEPVSKAQFQEELKELTLREYLELTLSLGGF